MKEIDIGLNIKKIRLSKGLTQKNVADILDISQTAYRKYEMENSVFRTDTLKKIADAFGVEITDLFTETDRTDENIRLIELKKQFLKLSEDGQEHTLNIIKQIVKIDKNY